MRVEVLNWYLCMGNEYMYTVQEKIEHTRGLGSQVGRAGAGAILKLAFYLYIFIIVGQGIIEFGAKSRYWNRSSLGR
jgi:hypothetical protein